MTSLTDLELLALHVCVHSARFETDDLRSELVDNPHLASAHARTVAEIRRRSDDEESQFYGREHEWTEFITSISPNLLSAAASRLICHPDWQALSMEERIARLQNALLPFVIDDAEAAEALAAAVPTS